MKKKIIPFLLLILLVVQFIPVIHAEEPQIFKFDRETGTILEYCGMDTEVVFPGEIDGIKVQQIGKPAIPYDPQNDDCDPNNYPTITEESGVKLTKITIPDTVTAINPYAFAYMDLETVIIPDSVINIHDNAFINNKRLKSVTLSKNINPKVGKSVFGYCDNLVYINLKEGISGIPVTMFQFATKLKKVVLPTTVKTIYNGAFSDCIRLEQISLPQKLVTLKPAVFYNCSRLKSIKLPKDISKISDSLFNGCVNLKDISIPKKVSKIDNSTFFNCPKLTKISIPSSVKSIGEMAFGIYENNLKAKKSIYIPKSVKTIEKNAFTMQYPLSDYKGKKSKQKSNIYTPKNSYAYKYAKKNLKKIKLYTPPTKVELNFTKVTIKVGKSKKIKATVFPDNLPKLLTWKTSDKKVAIYKSGKIKAIEKGYAKITVITINGKKSTCKVIVK